MNVGQIMALSIDPGYTRLINYTLTMTPVGRKGTWGESRGGSMSN